MSHELLVVFLDAKVPEEKIEEEVNALIRPHSDLDDHDDNANLDYRLDGWVIGGRYDGMIYGAQMERDLSPAEFQARYGIAFEKVELRSNIRPVSQLEEPFCSEIDALLTPGGKWVSRFDKEFKVSQNNLGILESKWNDLVSDVIQKNQDKLAVVVDGHS